VFDVSENHVSRILLIMQKKKRTKIMLSKEIKKKKGVREN